MNNEKVIIRSDKENNILVFWLESKANKYNICVTEISINGTVYAMSEASYDYYLTTNKASDKQTKLALGAIKSVYEIEGIVRKKISSKDRECIWNKGL
jgi:ATP-dependent RNA circularization protein (DNA/RNA ligase family)